MHLFIFFKPWRICGNNSWTRFTLEVALRHLWICQKMNHIFSSGFSSLCFICSILSKDKSWFVFGFNGGITLSSIADKLRFYFYLNYRTDDVLNGLFRASSEIWSLLIRQSLPRLLLLLCVSNIFLAFLKLCLRASPHSVPRSLSQKQTDLFTGTPVG